MTTVTKQDAAETVGFWGSLFQARLYKQTQGRIVRQVAFGVIALLAALAAYQLYNTGWFMSVTGSARSLVLVGLVLLGMWVAFRVVNVPRFADFLISVEAEMNKVSWPSKTELWRATAVVIFVIFALSFILFMFDAIWSYLFKLLNIRYLG
jgi:preprotein translocase subunit SecE